MWSVNGQRSTVNGAQCLLRQPILIPEIPCLQIKAAKETRPFLTIPTFVLKRLKNISGKSALSNRFQSPLRLPKNAKTARSYSLPRPSRLGKTTLSNIIARELSVQIHHTSGPALEKGGDLVSILTSLERSDVLFIDEIHRLPKVVEELLCPAMEDFAVDIIFDKGANARTYRSRLEWFTLIGATTRAGMLSRPMRERFGIMRELEFYTDEEIVRVIKRSALILNVAIDDKGAHEIARRSRGDSSCCKSFIKRVRDYCQVKADSTIDQTVARAALKLEGVDEKGLTILDRKYLDIIIAYYKGGPVGIEAIAATLQEDSGTLEELVEPFLLKRGYLIRTSSGRRATDKAYTHLDKIPPAGSSQPSLSFPSK